MANADTVRDAMARARGEAPPSGTATAVAERPALGAFDPSDATVVRYLGLDPNDARSRAVVAVCRTYGLDPLLKHVIVIPKGGVYITRDGYLHIAHRSGQLNGIRVDEPPHLTEDGREWQCTVTVYRKDMHYGFTFPGRYPVTGSNREYAPEMALKAAESHALRRAFNVTGLGAADEQRRPMAVDIEPEAEVEAEADAAAEQEWAEQVEGDE